MRLGTAKKSRIQASFCEVHNPEFEVRRHVASNHSADMSAQFKIATAALN
jgi:hypothetical protein